MTNSQQKDAIKFLKDWRRLTNAQKEQFINEQFSRPREIAPGNSFAPSKMVVDMLILNSLASYADMMNVALQEQLDSEAASKRKVNQ